MDEQRRQDYLNLIQALLNCRSWEEINNILNAHQNLIDEGLLQVMEQVVAWLAQQGDGNRAEFLKDVARQLAAYISNSANALPAEEYLAFLRKVLQAIIESNGNPEVVYPILSANQHKLNDTLAELFASWGAKIFSQVEPEHAADIAADFGTFSSLIQQFSLGNRSSNLEIAIIGYHLALQVFSREAFPQQWATAHNNLGAAYRNRIKGDKAENLENAIACSEQALLEYTREAFPQDWAGTQTNLGNAYWNRIKGDKAENLEKALACYEHALLEYTCEAFPQGGWALIQNNLGAVYRDRIKGDKAENLEKAIAYYEQALLVYTREAFPQDWAMTQNNLGNTYSDRIQGDKAENLEKALACYEQALLEYTREAFPQEWATTQNNLGSAYRDRIQGDKAENLEKALACCEQALLVLTRWAFPQEWAATQTNLGGAYRDRIQGDKAENLEQAIECCQQALLVRIRETFPQEWAMTQNNLGNAYSDRIKGDKAENLEEAIACFEQALLVLTHEAFPQDWAMTQNNLGTAYEERGQSEEAIQCYQSALEIFTPATFLLDCLTTGRNLGNLAFTVGRWREAIQGYAAAIDAVEESRSQAMTDERRQEIVSESIDIYEKMVQACINTRQFDKAFEYAERSRSKRLVDLMASKDLYSGGEIPPEVEVLLQAFQQKQQQIDQLRDYNNPSSERAMGGAARSRAKFEETNAKILALEAEKQQLWQQLRRLDPVLARQIKVAPPDIAALQQILDDERTAILSFYATYSDTYIFILRKNQIDCHICSGQGREVLQEWIAYNWLIPYLSDRAEWIKQMSGFLGELANRLNLNDLIANHLQGIDELILVPHLYLHLIPFAAMPISDKEKSEQFLGDKFLIRYVPSCQVWEFCQKRPRLDSQLDYGIAENTREDLHFSSFECQQVAELYQVSPERRLQGRRKATVAEYRRLVKQVQGILSSHHAQSRLDNPLESVLILGDGFITLGDLLTPGWRLQQLVDVFLSCCETAMGDTTLTDDILTIAFGFLCAGARSVVSTLWAVDDLATALFSLFYHQHKQMVSRPLALRKAQEDLRTLSGKKLEAEYKQAISGLLKEQGKQTTEELKQAYAALKQARKQSLDTVKFWQKEYLFFEKKRDRLEVSERCLERACKQDFPFSNSFYWAAFICQGVR